MPNQDEVIPTVEASVEEAISDPSPVFAVAIFMALGAALFWLLKKAYFGGKALIVKIRAKEEPEETPVQETENKKKEK